MIHLIRMIIRRLILWPLFALGVWLIVFPLLWVLEGNASSASELREFLREVWDGF